jgi:hypothetical protein
VDENRYYGGWTKMKENGKKDVNHPRHYNHSDQPNKHIRVEKTTTGALLYLDSGKLTVTKEEFEQLLQGVVPPGLIGKLKPDELEKLKKSLNAPNERDDRIDLIAELGGAYFSTPQGLRFYCGNNKIPVEIESMEFEGILAQLKYEKAGKIPSGEEILSVRRLARYYASKTIKNVGVRIGSDRDKIIYDPVRSDGKVYEIGKSGVTLKVPLDPATVRFSGMLEAEVQDGKKEDYEALLSMSHMDHETMFLSMGLDFSRFIPDIPHAIETVTGDHGAGKTSYTEIKREIVDPNGALSQSLKLDERDLSISALHQGVLAFDNVNTAMPDYISDILCRITTGQGFRTRELYTNTGEVVLKLKKSIIINGINPPGYKPDWLDRNVPINLRMIASEHRLTDNEIRERAAFLLPKVRGYLISLIPEAKRTYLEVEAELKGKLPRMADFVIWAECGLRAMGMPPLTFFNAFTQVKQREISDVARETTLIIAIQELMDGKNEWTGTTSELLENLNPYITENRRRFDIKLLPKDPTRLSRSLKEQEPMLRDLGFVIETMKDGLRTKKIKRLAVVDRVSVSSVSNEFDTTKYGFQPTDANLFPKSGVSDSVSKVEPTKSDVQSKTDATDVNHDEQGHDSNNDKMTFYPTNSDVHEQKEDGKYHVMGHDDQNPKTVHEYSITIEAGDTIKEQLFKMGYLVDPNSGITIDSRNYKIGIHGIGKLTDDKKTKLINVMDKEHFIQQNDGALGVKWYSRPLKRGDSQ